jgi:hypothetical protein
VVDSGDVDDRESEWLARRGRSSPDLFRQQLTAQQLSQIEFQNPAGVNGTSAATILSTGEIVPARILASERISGALVLTWAPGATLQTATNVSGPYSDIATSSPYTNHFTDAQRFFRLRE